MNNHNQNIHTVTHYRPIDLLRNTDEEVYNEVLSNIKKFKYLIKNINEDKIKIGNHILIKNNCIKSNKRLITRKMSIRSDKVIGTISNIFSHGLYSIIVDEIKGLFIEGEELIANYKQIDLITDEEWKLLKDIISEEKKEKKIIQDRKNNNNKCKNKKIKKEKKIR